MRLGSQRPSPTSRSPMTITDPAPSAPPVLDEGTRHALDATIVTLRAGEQTWAGLSIAQRIALLGKVHASVAAQSEQWVAAAVRAKNLDPDSPLVGEEWLSGPYCTLTALMVLPHTLAAVAKGESPVAAKKLGVAPGGRVTVPVLPNNAFEYLLLARLHRRRVDEARRQRGRRAGRRRPRRTDPDEHRRSRPRPGRRQHQLHRAARRALRAGRQQPRRPAQAQPDHERAAAGLHAPPSPRSSSWVSSPS